jgi:hypothetical protein
MSDLYIYATPPEAEVMLALDTGQVIVGVACTANGRHDAHRLTLPVGTLSQGSVLTVAAAGYQSIDHRGILNAGRPCFELDDVRLVAIPPPPTPPVRDQNADPQAICQAIFEAGDYDLSTKEGCGVYTEDCCSALFTDHWYTWGHILKDPAQNQYNGHAVDALQLLTPAGGTEAGIYDIIWSTESPEAKPAWSYKGPPDLNLWYPPI